MGNPEKPADDRTLEERVDRAEGDVRGILDAMSETLAEAERIGKKIHKSITFRREWDEDKDNYVFYLVEARNIVPDGLTYWEGGDIEELVVKENCTVVIKGDPQE